MLRVKVIKNNQRFFVEPTGLTEDENFANTRTYELLADLCFFVDNELRTVSIGRKGIRRERNFFEVTLVGKEQLDRIYSLQQDQTLKMVLWTCFGRGPMRRYAPAKDTLSSLIKSGLVTKGSIPTPKRK